MPILNTLLTILFLFGCAPHAITVSLNVPNIQESQVSVAVKNAQLDQQIYLTEFGFTGTSYIRMLSLEPPMEIALSQFIKERLTAYGLQERFSNIEVTVKRLEIKNKVGTAKNDELLCELESSLNVLPDLNNTDDTSVRTFSKNMDNTSPFIATAAKVILMQCLQQHASEIVDKLSNRMENRALRP